MSFRGWVLTILGALGRVAARPSWLVRDASICCGTHYSITDMERFDA